MKIGYVSNSGWPGDDTGLTFCVHSALGFSEAGADFRMLLRRQSWESPRQVLRDSFGIDRDLPIVPLGAPLLFGSRALFYLRAFLQLARTGADVVITRNLNFLPWAVTLRTVRGSRVWYEAHDFWTDPALRDEGVKPSRRRHVALERRWVGRTDGIFSVSEPLARVYRRYYPRLRVVAAPTACKPPRRSSRGGFSYTLGYLGSFDLNKYPLAVVIGALARLGDPRVRLVCAGGRTPAQVAAVERIATELGLGDRVEVLPWLAGDPLEEVKRRIDVGVAVLSDTFLNRVASPLKVLEYLAASLPFVATRLEGIEAVVETGRQGLLVENTPEAWAGAFREMYADLGRYRAMAEACYVLASGRGWGQRAQGMLAALAGAA